MGQTSVPETLVLHQKLTPGYNPKTFKQTLESLTNLTRAMDRCLSVKSEKFYISIYDIFIVRQMYNLITLIV
jgi:hypothetical protein